MKRLAQPDPQNRTLGVCMAQPRLENDMTQTVTTPATTEVMPIQTKHLASRFGMKATQLRRVLRAMPEYADGVHTNYRWAENDKRIADIAAAVKKLADDKAARAAAAKKALEERGAKLAAQVKADAKLA